MDISKSAYIVLILFLVSTSTFAHDPAKTNARDQWWWKDSWWDKGFIKDVKNHKVKTQWINYKSGNNTIRSLVARPADSGKYPGILFVHGRRGLDDLIQAKVKRLAARGLVVVAPDIYGSRFMDPYPYEHDYTIEDDVSRGVAAVLKRRDISDKKICLVSHTRGGYYTLKTAVTKRQQKKNVACYVSWYPHMQDPNAPEPSQVYGYAPEADDLTIPALIFIGENEQYQRRRPIESAVQSLKQKKRQVTLVIYPGVGRGFDFRPDAVRTFADDLAAKDANQRAARFIYKYLKTSGE
jgi:carboxymethylenebutenolidase